MGDVSEPYTNIIDTYAALVGGAKVAYHRLLLGDTTPGLLDVVARDPQWAYRHALYVIRGPWPAGEPAIAQHPEWAYYYARDVIGGPWPEAGIYEL